MKKFIKGLTPVGASCINFGFALVFIVLLLVLPFLSFETFRGEAGIPGWAMFLPGALGILIILVSVILALILGLSPFIKKRVNFKLSKVFTIVYILLALLAPVLLQDDGRYPSYGIGAIITIIIAIAWFIFTLYRKNEPTHLGNPAK